jgi:hypothetical protein
VQDHHSASSVCIDCECENIVVSLDQKYNFQTRAQSSSDAKQKLTSLIKKLEKLADKMEIGTNGGAKSGDEEAEAPKDEEMATTAPTKKSNPVKTRGRKFGVNCDFAGYLKCC